MSIENSLFTSALGLSAPWEVADVRFDPAAGRIDFDVHFVPGSRFACPSCGAEAQAAHDTRERSWRHLHFFEYEAYIHAHLPRVRCNQCGKTSEVPAPWARTGSGFTQLFEALALTLCRAMPVHTVAQHLGVSDDAPWRLVGRYVETAREREDFSEVTTVGIDETAVRRGHDYITPFHDLKKRRLLFACPGRDQDTVGQFATDLKAHGGQAEAGGVTATCINMSKAYIAGVGKHLPGAAIIFDVFHIVSLANEVLEAVRREEARSEPGLRHSRWTWLKDKSRWSDRQIGQYASLSRLHLRTARAWRLKEALRELFATAPNAAEAQARFGRWYSWARRSRQAPMKRLAATLSDHLPGIFNGFDSGLANGAVEGINSLIQAAKARARGYRSKRNLINVAYLIAGNLTHLPATPYTTTSGGQPLSVPS